VPKLRAALMLLAFSVLFLALAPGGAMAQASYPDRVVKIVVPAPASSGFDVVGRILADVLARRTGQGFVIENRTGAGTLVGTQSAAEAAPDGYTLLIGGWSNIIFNAGLYKNQRNDPIKAFVPVALVFDLSYSMVASKQSGLTTPQQVIEAAKAAPGKLTLANAGHGTGHHIFGRAFQRITGVQMQEVPYRGSAPAWPDVLSGRIDVFIDTTPGAQPYIQSGQVNGIGLLAPRRRVSAPDFPTMAERGVSGLDVESWVGVFAPAGTPPAIVARLQKEIEAAMPELTPRFIAAGGEPLSIPADKVQAQVLADHAKWLPIVRGMNITLD